MIKNKEEIARSEARTAAINCLEKAIETVHPSTIIEEKVALDRNELSIADTLYDLQQYEEIVVFGGGNAAGHVALALENLLGDRISRGAVVTNDPTQTQRVSIYEGDYPTPSKQCMEGTLEIINLAESLNKDSLGLVILSGGGSPLLSAPVADISLTDLQIVTNALFENGVPIAEINAVRKHLSAIKGGQLARASTPATLISLVFSDIVGNDLSVIASGPLTPDDTTYQDALDILDRYGISVPTRVRDHLYRGTLGVVPETPGPECTAFENITHHILADGIEALEGAKRAALEAGYNSVILSSRIRGEPYEAAKSHVAIAEEILATGNPVEPPAIILSGGETPVSDRGQGAGRPNQEFALGAAVELEEPTITVASLATDGHDGNTNMAGAIVDASTIRSDSDEQITFAADHPETFLDEQGDLIQTGTTGTNVNDIHVVSVGELDKT